MVSIDSGPFTLACHPQTPSQAIRKIDVLVEESENGGLMLTFRLVGDISALNIPEYREFNFSPSGEWAVYTFRGYRNGGVL